ncbi:hypothetical protein HOY80DRAFT_1087909 [Tuber brumale]|nr:hypothetical protein HOY80DRAFT_1087909 [Tuber brumale]
MPNIIVPDESTFNANDGRSKIWIKENPVPLKKKTRGKGIIVSDFLIPGGRLRVSKDESETLISEYGTSDQGPKRLDPYLAACSIEYGGDTWWDGNQLVEQVLRLEIPLFHLFIRCIESQFNKLTTWWSPAATSTWYTQPDWRNPTYGEFGQRTKRIENGLTRERSMEAKIEDIILPT